MPIITPAYPSMCATHNISMSTKAVILRELQRGGDMVDKIFVKRLSWENLFARHTFFTNDYKYYLCITASSKTKEAEGVWSGLVESKLRHLVGALDYKATIAIAHPFPKGFERTHLVTNDQEMEAVKNGSTNHVAKGTKTETTDETNNAAHQAAVQNTLENAEVPEPTQPTAEADGHTVYTTTYYIGLELKPLEPGIYSYPPFTDILISILQRSIAFPRYLHRLAEIQVSLYIMARIPKGRHGTGCHSRPEVCSSFSIDLTTPASANSIQLRSTRRCLRTR